MIWYDDMIWYDMIWYDMIWYDIRTVKGLFLVLIFGGAYFRREISVSKSAGLIIGGNFLSAIFECANDNIGALSRN